ncbi:SHOCT domain-containing protein [Microbacterium sp. HD4P20]|uniref:SHOCT domain-containing protein n=1 Tax=Microbacterium sp. HD4P20 TaxID=2864874 RepID=UPI001C63F758|nr:SHOCT domain-containing protein [Microbacterium sp. HD4P20]MCP2635570.1 SHOCT domain-containing protein [Microbacterium sp. HD4P20]
MGFWDLLLWIFSIFVFVAYLMVVFSIIGDIFRDESLNGWLKAVWILFLIFVPFLTALVYLIARGAGMQKRSVAQAEALRSAQDAYIRQAAGGASSAADDITKAKSLLDAGAISQAEFDALKTKALAA